MRPDLTKNVILYCLSSLAFFTSIIMDCNFCPGDIVWGLSTQQGFQSGPVPGTFTRLRSCIVPAEITEPPPKLAVVKSTRTIDWWNIFHKKLMITSVAEFSHSNQTTAFSHDQVDGIFPVLKRHRLQIRRKRIRSLGSTSTTGGSCD